MSRATLTSKGQITIPNEIRKELHLRTGDQLDFILRDDGTAIVRPTTRSLKALKGMIPASRPVSLDEMKNAIRNRKKF